MSWALVAVALAALCSGGALVLQARAARAGHGTDTMHVALVWRLVQDRTYLAAMVLVATGFALAFVALRVLPVFIVQAGRASSLAVAALLAVRVLGTRMSPLEWGGLALTGVGLVLLASSTTAVRAGSSEHASAVLVAVVLVIAGVGAWAAARPPTRGLGVVLALLAGCGFSVLAAGVHTLVDLAPLALLASTAAWAAAAGGGLGLLLTALAFQRAPAVAVSAVVTGVETVGGAVLGVLLAGDHAAAGREAVAIAGFVLVLAGSSVVARFGTPEVVAVGAG
ncbi:MAG: hypothetical protein KJ548_07815 [Actinobacteria bacterium]|nr:hypothetical protein [Actinomycetota bacterium]MCG2799864.1 hypothetical protein [Cellulomonas sp.]